ncbi:MAG: hypothetical protein ACFCUX_05740 [Candidatus Methylacidiphilales bacterium]
MITEYKRIRRRRATCGLSLFLVIMLFGGWQLQAKNDHWWKEVEKAEKDYKDKSKMYKKLAVLPGQDAQKSTVYTKLSDNYSQLADMKSDSLKAAKKGKPYSWDAYHKLAAENQKLEKTIKATDPDPVKKEKPVAVETKKKSESEEIEELKRQIKALEAKVEAKSEESGDAKKQ